MKVTSVYTVCYTIYIQQKFAYHFFWNSFYCYDIKWWQVEVNNVVLFQL